MQAVIRIQRNRHAKVNYSARLNPHGLADDCGDGSNAALRSKCSHTDTSKLAQYQSRNDGKLGENVRNHTMKLMCQETKQPHSEILTQIDDRGVRARKNLLLTQLNYDYQLMMPFKEKKSISN